jgi:glycosyltransferase involved in cell wall biosynthesis
MDRMIVPGCAELPKPSIVCKYHGGSPRILYIVTRAEHGGAQVHVLRLALSMRRDFDIAVATGEEGFLTKECRNSQIPVYVIPYLSREIRPIADTRAFWAIQALIRRLQPDLIHAHTFKAGFLGRLASRVQRVPSIYTIHTWLFGTPALPRLWSALGPPCERAAANWCERVITVSNTGAHLAEHHHLAPQSKIVVIPNGIPDCAERAELGSSIPTVVIMVARFSQIKEHDVLLRAFATIRRGTRLRLVGDGPTRAHCERLAQELGIQDRVDFLGDRDDVGSLLARSDVFVLASKFEMSPISILEAMRAGLPVIASNSGGAREAVVDGETGFLVPAGSVEALAEALARVADDYELRVRLGRAARQRFEESFLCARQEALIRSVYVNVLFGSGRIASDST